MASPEALVNWLDFEDAAAVCVPQDRKSHNLFLFLFIEVVRNSALLPPSLTADGDLRPSIG
jgi:hypothetical protein